LNTRTPNTKMYLTEIAFYRVGVQVVDIGSRKTKCVVSAVMYGVSMATIFMGGHFDRLLLGRVIYGAASSLHHSSFEGKCTTE
jgi:hypothetical protein